MSEHQKERARRIACASEDAEVHESTVGDAVVIDENNAWFVLFATQHAMAIDTYAARDAICPQDEGAN